MTPAIRRAQALLFGHSVPTVREVLSAALDVEEIARVLVLHTRADAGRCTCGYAGPIGSSFAVHQVGMIRLELLGPP
jgi:hypothetical protein